MLVIAVALMAIIMMVQIVGVSRYVRWLANETVPRVPDARLPRAAVILSLRGADPFLGECLDRLTTQDYPRYEVHVIVDHPTDPALEVVEKWMSVHPDHPLQLSFLRQRSDGAYLKTSAVRQGVETLNPSVEVAVLADADTLVYRGWLRDMVAPLTVAGVGVATGNRWYDPNLCHWGSLVRYIYNAACVVPMYFMRATWGGSLSMRREVFASDFFLDRMLNTPCEDNAIQEAARHTNLQLALQPNVMILNREECTLKSCFGFIRRQLIWTRLYHSSWPQVVALVIGLYLMLSTVFVTTLVTAATGKWLVATVLAVAMMIQWVTSQLLVEWLHRAISRRTASVQDEPYRPITWPTRFRLLLALPVALVVISWAVISATFSQQVCWRGVDYQIIPPDAIRMVNYRPYAQVLQTETDEHSLT
ncbi:MAG: glycosyltransferase [Planctomycetes bacterium]|nr:glycosyltransferase [Planctomycetota bacterium]